MYLYSVVIANTEDPLLHAVQLYIEHRRALAIQEGYWFAAIIKRNKETGWPCTEERASEDTVECIRALEMWKF